MKTMPYLKVRISGLLTGIMVLTMLSFPAVAGNDTEETVAADQSVAIYASSGIVRP